MYSVCSGVVALPAHRPPAGPLGTARPARPGRPGRRCARLRPLLDPPLAGGTRPRAQDRRSAVTIPGLRSASTPAPSTGGCRPSLHRAAAKGRSPTPAAPVGPAGGVSATALLLEVTVHVPTSRARSGVAPTVSLVSPGAAVSRPRCVGGSVATPGAGVYAAANDTSLTTGGGLPRLVGLTELPRLGRRGGRRSASSTPTSPSTSTPALLCGRLPACRGPPPRGRRHLDCAGPRRRLEALVDLVAVRSAGSRPAWARPRVRRTARPRLRRARRRAPPDAGGGLLADQVPWFRSRAGVPQFHLGRQGSTRRRYQAYVDAGHVRSWPLLLDAAIDPTHPSAG